MMTRTPASKLLPAAMLLLALFPLNPLPGSSPDRKEKKDTAPAQDLVWPAPPDKPRVRYLRMIRSLSDVAGKKKPSLVERLSGKPSAQELLSLQKPYGVAVDKRGRVYVADPAQRGVVIFDLEGKSGFLRTGNAQFPLFTPVCVALDDAGRLFVSDSHGAQVVVFEQDGKPAAVLGKGVLQRPGGLAVDSTRKRVYVADVSLNEVLVFDVVNLRLLKRIGGKSKSGEFEPGTFASPTNVALDGRGRLYVTDTFNARVQIFESDGRFLRLFGKLGDRPGSFARPKGIAVDSEGHIYVADAAFGNFQIFSPDGKPLLFVGSGGDGPGQFVLPAGMAIDAANRIYVVEQRPEAGRLQVFEYLPEKAGSPQAGKD